LKNGFLVTIAATCTRGTFGETAMYGAPFSAVLVTVKARPPARPSAYASGKGRKSVTDLVQKR
jgi:hypothetical protein